jgi:hypothetical protein
VYIRSRAAVKNKKLKNVWLNLYNPVVNVIIKIDVMLDGEDYDKIKEDIVSRT